MWSTILRLWPEVTYPHNSGYILYRGMMVDSKVAQDLYSTCQQNISMCPKSVDIGCQPVDVCPECYNTVITQDTCGCDVAECGKYLPIPLLLDLVGEYITRKEKELIFICTIELLIQ